MNVYEFKRPDGTKPHQRVADILVDTTAQKTNSEIFNDVYQDVIGNWQRFAQRNHLNEFIRDSLPAKAHGPEGEDYVNDLNVISKVEQKLDIRVSIFYPGCTTTNPLGWLVVFHRGTEIFSTPPDMVSEANARALNIVLYLAFEATMKTLGRE